MFSGSQMMITYESRERGFSLNTILLVLYGLRVAKGNIFSVEGSGLKFVILGGS